MTKLTDIQGLSFYGYKSYVNIQDTNLGPLCNFNVIIGKNNTGKTSFIDIIDALIHSEKLLEKQYAAAIINFAIPLDLEHISKGFSRGMGHQFSWHYPDDFSYAQQFIGKPIILTLQGKAVRFMVQNASSDNIEQECWQRVASAYLNYFSSYYLLKIQSERDIKPEPEDFTLQLLSNGEGASNLIRAFINQSEYKEKLIEETLLKELNTIMGSDAHFTRIQIQQIISADSSRWEIYLEEKDVGRFALSKSGSGLKTIILVLLNLLVLPTLNDYKKRKPIFAFEELENNLHPALQRRLFDYLYRFSISTGTPIFLTTHSHVAIDMFCHKMGAQVLHVTKENHESRIKKVDSFFDKKAILDDLAVKASDLFQSNGIIWVEGPSDRVYINKWLEIFCNSKYQEGRDFQYLYYGGRLLSHYSIEELENKINILTTNHNSAIVMDSDKKNKNERINDTKKRVEREFVNKKLFCWVTKGKEIENYLPKEAISKIVHQEVRQCKQYQSFSKYIKGTYANFENKKTSFANEVKEYITVENSKDIFDLRDRIEELYKRIEEWNRID